MAKTRNRAAIFARYSSSLQNDLSLEAQVTEIERYCEREGFEITHRFLLPETRSALVERSEEFQAMVRAARRGEFDQLVVHKLDRFTRDRDIAVAYKALLRRHNVTFRSVTENLGDGLYDRMIAGFLEVIAEFYSLNLANETKKGQRAATRRGRWTGGTVPFGYKRGQDGQGHTVLEEHPSESKVLRQVYEMYADGIGTKEILDYTEEATSKRWRYPTLQNRLKNKTYIGILEYGKTSLDAKGNRTTNEADNITTGECVALIDENLWKRVRARMGEHKKRNRPSNYDYLLTKGGLTCAACGRPVVGACRGRDNLPYYLCSGWRDKLCPAPHRSARADLLEEAFENEVRNEILSEMTLERFERACKFLLDQRQQMANAEERDIQADMKSLSKQKKNLMDFILGGGAKSQASMLGQKLREIEEQEEELGEQLATVKLKSEQKVTVVVDAMREWYRNAIEALKLPSQDPQWRRVVRQLFEVEWDFEHKTGTVYLIPAFAEMNQGAEHLLPGRIRIFRSAQI